MKTYRLTFYFSRQTTFTWGIHLKHRLVETVRDEAKKCPRSADVHMGMGKKKNLNDLSQRCRPSSFKFDKPNSLAKCARVSVV